MSVKKEFLVALRMKKEEQESVALSILLSTSRAFEEYQSRTDVIS